MFTLPRDVLEALVIVANTQIWYLHAYMYLVATKLDLHIPTKVPTAPSLAPSRVIIAVLAEVLNAKHSW